VRIRVKKDAPARTARELEFLVDSGAVHSVVPGDVLRKIGVKPFKTARFILANGETAERKVGTAHFMYKDREGGAPVIFGEKGDSVLLGATTLEAMELALNPLTRDLYPLQMTLMSDATLWVPGPPASPSRRRRGMRGFGSAGSDDAISRSTGRAPQTAVRGISDTPDERRLVRRPPSGVRRVVADQRPGGDTPEGG
jgi:clan AA aspartic protease